MRRLLILIFIPFLLQACAPKPVFRMSPMKENTTFNQGTEYVHLQQGGIELTIPYYKHLSDKFVMHVEIANETDSVLRVDPTAFSYKAYKT